MRLLSLTPRISKGSGKIVATSDFRIRLLSLGAFYRNVTLDLASSCVVITSRSFWLHRRRRTISFGEVEAVTYDYDDVNNRSLWSNAHDAYDWFSVGLRTKDGASVHLFHFLGDGNFTHDGALPDWIYLQNYLFDSSGDQEMRSREYVDLISNVLNVGVKPSSSSSG